jgi:plasmid replication initiation protein
MALVSRSVDYGHRAIHVARTRQQRCIGPTCKLKLMLRKGLKDPTRRLFAERVTEDAKDQVRLFHATARLPLGTLISPCNAM